MIKFSGGQKAVALFRGRAGHRLEPMRVVRRALLDRPLHHRLRNLASHFKAQAAAAFDRTPQRSICLGSEPFFHYLIRKNIRSERGICFLRFDLRHSLILLFSVLRHDHSKYWEQNST